MSRPARISLAPGFFNPQPRRVKGKERMTDPTRPEVLSAYSARCQEWSCRMRISVGCSSGPVLTSKEESIPRRPRSTRRARKPPLHVIPRHYDRVLVPILHSGQTRHVSHSSESPSDDSDPPFSNSDAPALDPPTASSSSHHGALDSEAQSNDISTEELNLPPEAPDPFDPPLPHDISETDSPPSLAPSYILVEDSTYTIDPAERVSVSQFLTPPEIPIRHDRLEQDIAFELPSNGASSNEEDEVQRLRRLIEAREKKFKLEATWHAYEVVETSGQLSSLTPRELLVLSDHMLRYVESHYEIDELEDLHQWGGRIRRILEAVRATAPPSVDLAVRSSMARAMALEGDLQKALDILHRELPQYEDSGPVLHVYESVLVSTWRHYDRLRALEFLVLEWKIIGSHLLTETSRVHTAEIASLGSSLRKKAHNIISGISLPAVALADKELDWSEERRRHLGELLMEAFFRAKLPIESLEVLREMRRQGIRPAVHLPLHLVRVLARENLFIDAHTLYSSLAGGAETHAYLFTGLYLHAQEGNHEEAENYYNRIVVAGQADKKDVLQLMYSYAVQGKIQQTLQVFNEFFPEDDDGIPTNAPLIEHYAVAIFAHAQRGDTDGTNRWVQSMHRLGLRPEVYVFTTILKSFALRGELQPMAVILDQMRTAGIQPNVVTYTTVMTLLAHRKDPASVEAIYKRAIRDGIVPDRVMVATLMNAHIEAGSWKGVIRAFDFIRSSPHLRLSIGIYNLLLKAYIQIGAPFRIVSRVFNQLERLRVRPDAYTFAMLIQSACDSRQMNIASDIFLEMDKLSEHWGSSRHINSWTMTIIMAGFLRLGDKVRAKAVYDDMISRNLEPNAVTYGVILSAYGRERTDESMQIAEAFIKDLTARPKEEQTWDTPPHGRLSPRDYLYLPLMYSYAARCKPEEVVRLFDEMLEAGGEPSLSMLTTLLDAYARVGDIENVLQLWPQIFTLGVRYSKVPLFEEDGEDQSRSKMHTFVLCIPLSCYIDALSRAGLHDEIAAVWKSFQANGFSFSAENWNQLAMALLRTGEVERGFEVLELVLLPYHRRSNRLRSERDPNPDSPLSLDVPTSDQQPLEMPLMGRARGDTTGWARYHQRAADDFNDPRSTDDLAHHLHLLHRISPMWNTWMPRSAVLRMLFQVILRLRAGYPADAAQREIDDLHIDSDALQRRIEEARARLHGIYAAYPDTMALLDSFELRERRRLGRWFPRVYLWASTR